MGRFIRSVLCSSEADGEIPFSSPSTTRSAGNTRALTQILAKLGGSDIATNLSEISRLARLGALPLTLETHAEIIQAAADIADMKSMLMQALRIKEH